MNGPDGTVLYVEAATAIGELIVVATERCELDGNPLVPKQQVGVIAAALMAFDGLGNRIDRLTEMADLLDRLPEVEEP